jgi:hypothetical protein
MGELAQLSGRPALVDAHAQGPVEALVIPPGQLRALLIAEAELGERIMRALILRRVAILETGAGGPVIVGRAENGDVLRLQGFLRRNGHPYRRLDPETDPDAKALIERFHVESGQLPIVLCPDGQLLRNPSESELARCLRMVRPIDPKRVYDVAVVGAGNSAGQAAVYLANQSGRVWLLARGDDLAASMSRYLVDRITGLPNVEVLRRTNVTGLEGHDGMLEAIRWRRGASGEEVRRPIQHLFLFIGAEPNTGWLSGSGVALDAKGFVLTGADTANKRRSLETSREGVFAIGDVRSGSVKRVAAAVGEGAQVVATLHAYLAAAERVPAVATGR